MSTKISAEKIFNEISFPLILKEIKNNKAKDLIVDFNLDLNQTQELFELLLKNTSVKAFHISMNNHSSFFTYFKEFLENNFSLTDIDFICPRLRKQTILFSEGFTRNKNLKILNITGYPLDEFEIKVINQVLFNLEALYLTENRIKEKIDLLCDGIKNTTSLKRLSITFNEINPSETFCHALTHNNSIKTIVIFDNSLDIKIYECINKMKKIKSVNFNKIHYNQQNEKEKNILINSVKGLSLKFFNIGSKGIPDKVLAKTLLNLNYSSLKTLEMEENACGFYTYFAILKILKFSNLRKLFIYDDLKREHIKILSEGLQESRSIEELEICHSSFEMKFLKYFDIGKNQSLKSLNINAKLSPFKYIIDGISSNKSITKLELQSNGMTEIEAIQFSNYLEKNKSIKYLNLALNKIKDVHLKAILNALKEHKNFETLGLAGNPITTEGITYLHDFYKMNSSLTHLDIRYIDIGESIHLLGDFLRNIKKIQLEGCGITSKSESFIKNNIFWNLSLIKLNLEENFLEIDFFKDVEYIISRNKYFIEIPYQLNHSQDIHFSFSSINTSEMTFENEKESKKRKFE